MRINKESVDRFYDYDIHVESRTIYMGSTGDHDGDEHGTNYSMAERTIKGLHLLDNSAPLGDKPITIIMNNPGGDVYHGTAIYDVIKSCKNHVTIIVYGYAMSMGSIILQSADKRIMSKNSVFMIHYGNDGFSGHSKVLSSVAKEAERCNAWMENLYLEKIRTKKPNFTLAKLKEMCNFDTFLTAEQALEYGFIDEILEEG